MTYCLTICGAYSSEYVVHLPSFSVFSCFLGKLCFISTPEFVDVGYFVSNGVVSVGGVHPIGSCWHPINTVSRPGSSPKISKTKGAYSLLVPL